MEPWRADDAHNGGVEVTDLHHFDEEHSPDPHNIEKLDRYWDPHLSEKLDQDPQ
jgi:hypothetical protein